MKRERGGSLHKRLDRASSSGYGCLNPVNALIVAAQIPLIKPKVRIVQNVGLCLYPTNHSHLQSLSDEISIPSAINPRPQIWHTILAYKFNCVQLFDPNWRISAPKSAFISLKYVIQYSQRVIRQQIWIENARILSSFGRKSNSSIVCNFYVHRRSILDPDF